MTMPRTLIAGFGIVLRGDDGFGVAVIRRLYQLGVPSRDVELLDVGTGGIRLAQELLGRYDQLIILDAKAGPGPPGRVEVLAVEGVAPAGGVDLHQAVPSQALALAKALGSLPSDVIFIGCRPGDVDELTTELSPPVRKAVETAVQRVLELLAPPGGLPPRAARPDDPVAALQLRDEILQVMYWLRGEGLQASVTEADLHRFLAVPAGQLASGLARLVADGHLEVPGEPAGRYRLSPLGIREGGRRFQEEFAPFLGREGHGQCGDPNCECQTSGEVCARLGESPR
jgi:hydrogenase maturation protease